MSPYRRNVMVGLTVLIALLILGWMILKFGGDLARPFAPKQYQVRFVTTRADGLAEGSGITFRGVTVGKVLKVDRSADGLEIVADASIDDVGPRLPGNVVALIKATSALGAGSTIALDLPNDTAAEGTLRDGQTIQARYVGLDLIPLEFSDVARELTQTLKQFRQSNLVGNFNEQVTRFGKVMESAQVYLDDPQVREDVKESIRAFRAATENARQLSADLQTMAKSLDERLAKLSEQSGVALDSAKGAFDQTRQSVERTEQQIASVAQNLNGRLDQLSTALGEFQNLATKLNSTTGTAGLLVNDPRLYESLVDSAQELSLTIADIKRLVRQWEKEGLGIKLK
jgi:phospholipid/cholesterol/gamma-HCH transport system substrate-binding protein